MLEEPTCFTRKCKHYLGVIQPDGTELTEKNYCKAFPKGIPNDIAYGDDKHLKVRDAQDNEITYEKGEMDFEEDDI